MYADADSADDDQDSRCSASQYVQVRPPEPRILFQNRSYLSLTVRGYTTQSAFCNLDDDCGDAGLFLSPLFTQFWLSLHQEDTFFNVPFGYLLPTIGWEGLTESRD